MPRARLRARLAGACLLAALPAAALPALAAMPVPAAMPPPRAAATPALSTGAERSGFVRTGRYEEVLALCDAFAKAYPDAVRCQDFGASAEGRPLKLLVATRTGAFDPGAAAARHVPVLLVQGGIHAGEIDGKDAGFLALREVLEGKAARGALAKQVWLFVPVFNADGHERFAAWNRPNQRGPEQMGWRATAQDYNLNRDYMKADTPEMQAMLGLVDAWDPLATVDLHVTDGAKFQHGVSVEVQPALAGDAVLAADGRALQSGVIARLDAKGAMALPFYPSFVEDDDPASGFAGWLKSPRYSDGYFWQRNRFGMLVETHSWKDYATRVRITHDAIVALLEQVRDHGAQWRRDADAADARATQLAGSTVPLDWKPTGKVRMIDFQGYAYTRTPSDVSGAPMTHYDETTPQVWHVPMRDEMVPAHSAVAPGAGYIVPVAWAPVVEPRLRAQGLAYRRLDAAIPHADVQAWRAGSFEFARQSFEGHQRLAAEGAWKAEPRDVPAGSLFVPIAQPKARLLMGLLEPDAPDSLLQWGYFNNAFEQKEYMEAYVAEDVARQMLEDPAVRAEFDKRLREDKAFAASPRQRLQFFARRHPSWDEQLGMYPVLRADAAP